MGVGFEIACAKARSCKRSTIPPIESLRYHRAYNMPTDKVAKEFYEVSKLSKYDFEPYWPEKKLKICVTGAGGFIASHLAKRLKSEGHYIIGCDWKRNEHMPVCMCDT